MNPAPEVLGLRGVGKSFATPRGPVRVLAGVDGSVRRGERIVMTGPSGSGKTTLLHLMGLLDAPDEGELLLDGAGVSALSDDERTAIRREKIGMVFQRFFLLPNRSALENVMFRLRYQAWSRSEKHERAMRALEDAGLAPVAHTPARLLSGGEMQRVAIARAVVLPPLLLLADEPTGNLDAASTARVMEMLGALGERGVTLVLATHNPRLLDMATRHWNCRDGRVEEAAP